MRAPYILSVVFLFLFFCDNCIYAQSCKLVSPEGLKGEELRVVAVDPDDPEKIFLGTQRGLYRRDEKSDTWKSAEVPAAGIAGVNQILFGRVKNEYYVASDTGLYLIDIGSGEMTKLFDRFNDKERKCLTVCVSKNGNMFVGTHAGLFMKKKDAWVSVNDPFGDKKVISLFCSGGSLYAALDSEVYKSNNDGKSWEKIYSIYHHKENDDSPEISDGQDTENPSKTSFRHITGSKYDQDLLYAITASVIFFTKDGGRTWAALPLAGLDATDLRFVLVSQKNKELLAASKSGVYRYKDGEWKLVAPGHNFRYLAVKEGSLLIISDRDIFECSVLQAGDASYSGGSDDGIYSFTNEPTVQEVHTLAIEYAEVSSRKIAEWRRRAAAKAFLPEVSIGVDRNTTDLWHWEGGSTAKLDDDFLRKGSDSVDWDISLKWDLSELIFNSAQTSIDTRSKLMVELRNDILSEVTRLYFERRKLQIESLTNGDLSRKAELDKKLRILELTALIDRLTGGNFSRLLKSTE